MENMIEFIKENPPTMGKSITSLPKFYNRLSTVCQRMAVMTNRVQETDADLAEAAVLHNELTRYVRAKFKQGKSWSGSFVNAFISDAIAQANSDEEE